MYVRYLGAQIDTQTFSDDIILDQTAPTLSSASISGTAAAASATIARAGASRKLGRYLVKLIARDSIVGVCAVEASNKRSGGTVTNIANCHKKGISRLSRVYALSAQFESGTPRAHGLAG